MTQFSSSTQAALLRWINTFDTRRKAASLADLQDGVVLGQALEQMLAPEFQSSSLLQHPTTHEENKQNLEMVYRGLASFLRSDNPFLAPSPSEFRAMVEHPDDNSICDFICVFLTAACLGSLSRTYVPRVMSLDKTTQGEIAKIISQKHQLKAEREEKALEHHLPDTDDLDSVALRDPALMEEELNQVKEKYEMLKKQNADLQSRIDKLLDTREAVLHELRVAQDELAAQKKARGTDASNAIRDLRNEIRDKMAEIDRLEDLAEKETLKATRLEKENESLRAKVERLKDLEDKVTVLEHENKQQQQQIKGLENYKKKAQDLTVIQQRNRVLDEQILQLEQDLRDLEDLKLLNRKLQKEIEEKSKVLANNEQEIIYTIQSKNVLQDTNEELKRRVEYLESRRQLDESTIKELQDQLQLSDVPPMRIPDSPGASASKFSLEQELETTSDPLVALRVEISRLRAENNVLRNNVTVVSENEKLRGELDLANQKVDHLRLQCTEAMEKEAVTQEQLQAMVNNMTGEESAAFIKLRRDYLDAIKDVEMYRKKIQDLEAVAADRERELLHVKTDLNVIGQEQTTALAALKSSDEFISDSLKTELDATRRQASQKSFELDEMKEQLMAALVSKDKIRKQLDDAIAAAANGQPAPEEATKGRKEDAEKIDKLKAALRLKIEQLEKSEHEKYELQRRLKATENGGAFAAQKATYDQEIKTLQRENAMMTTAWYDLTSRLQSNHVVLQRRQDAPKSWLMKQRQQVNATTPRR
ncbi:protein hook [Echria macrotheca]|uniref:Protein hook n=1 Tax=Echria macrotheca TaxID=438768 RepID=A0AAJ0BC48_9PEZI|nr:protein hook [Echria macrotheca]